MKNPFEGMFGRGERGGERESENAEVAEAIAAAREAGEQSASDAARETMLKEGQLQARLQTLYRFSHEGSGLVEELKNASISSADFLEKIEEFNMNGAYRAAYEGGPTTEGPTESFTFQVGSGRTIEVTLYTQTGRVVLAGAAGTVH